MATQAGKAYMSTTYDRMAHHCAFVPPNARPVHIDEWLENDRAVRLDAESAAMNEARAILAETEPIQSAPWWAYRVELKANGALYASLAAILPILDALEAEARQ